MKTSTLPYLSVIDLLFCAGELTDDGTPRFGEGDGRSLLPCWDGGNPTLVVQGKPAGDVFVVYSSASAMEEHVVMRDTGNSTHARHADVAPRTPLANADSVVADGAPQPFADLAAYKSGVRGRLGLGGSETATYARGAGKRLRITNVGTLAGAVSEASPASKKITRLVGVDGSNNAVEGWVYVETASTQGSNTLVFKVHQLVPAGMVLPPNGEVTQEAYNNPSNWDLAGLINAKGAVGMKYCVAVCWSSPVSSTSDIQNASMPSAPSSPSGTEDWS